MADREIEIDDKTYGENTKINLSVKTLLWIVGILFSLVLTAFGLVYFDNQAKFKEQDAKTSKQIEKELVNYKEDLSEVKIKVNGIETTVNNMNVSVGIILDRSNRSQSQTGVNVRPSDNIPKTLPTTDIPLPITETSSPNLISDGQ